MLQATALRRLNVRTGAALYQHKIIRVMKKGETFYVADRPIIKGDFVWRQHVAPDGKLLDRYSPERYCGGTGIVYFECKPVAGDKIIITAPTDSFRVRCVGHIRSLFNANGDWLMNYDDRFVMLWEAV